MGGGAGKGNASLDDEPTSPGSQGSPTSPGGSRLRRRLTTFIGWESKSRYAAPTAEERQDNDSEEEELDNPLNHYVDKVENHGFVGDFYVFDNKVLHKDKITTVRKVTQKTLKRPRALKQFSKKMIRDCSDVIKTQVGLIQDISAHPSIIRLHETFEDKMFYYLIFEFCCGGRLLDHIQEDETHTERETACVVQQILRATGHLHEHRVCHRDIKPEHILIKQRGWLADCQVKVIDFAHAKLMNRTGQVMHERVGTPFYSSPQVHLGSYTELCDLWSCGVVMHLLLFGYKSTALGQNLEQTSTTRAANFGAGREFAFVEEEWQGASEGARDILGRLLCTTEDDRVAAAKAVQHAWVVRLAPQPSNVRVQLSTPNLTSPDVLGASRVRLVGDFPEYPAMLSPGPGQKKSSSPGGKTVWSVSEATDD
jgi:calcium-dependent protein kinase